MRSRRVAVGLFAVAVLGVGAWYAAQQRPRPTSGTESVDPSLPDPTLPPPTPATERSAARPPPPVSAAAPAGCEGDAPDPEGFVRPSVWELVRLRNQELRDRLPQISRDASEPLRRGLNGLGDEEPTAALEALMGAPDRDRDGFDVAVAGLLTVTSRFLAARDLPTAQRWAQRAATEAPDDPLAHAIVGVVARERGAERTAWQALSRAFALAPDEPSVALLFARASADVGEHARAREAVDAYLREMPDDARLSAWRERVEVRGAMTGTHARRTWDGVEVLFPAEGAPLVDDVMETVDGALRAMARVIGASRRPELTVIVYRTRAELRRATCSPEWTGALFDGALHVDLARLARPDWQRIVRHESSHAQLALVRGRIPFWLNEGIAQWMEGDLTDAKRRRFGELAARGVWIPFASLEGPFLVIEDPTDAGFAYDQSLGMVLFLVDRAGQRAISEALTLVERGEPEDLLERLAPGVTGADLLAYLGSRSRPSTPPRGSR